MYKILYLTIALLGITAVSPLYAYPPDNAAVLYYKHMEYYTPPQGAIGDEISDLPTSGKPASQELIDFIEKQKQTYLIPELKIASHLKYCDWGLDLSQGFGLQMPGLSKMRSFAYLLLADGAIQAAQGDLAGAIDNNLAVRRMAHHRSNETLISYLVAYVMVQKSDEALYHLLATQTLDETSLVELKRELLLEPYRPLSIRETLIGERNVAILEIPTMTAEKFKQYQIDISDDDLERARKIFKNPDFAENTTRYIEAYYDRVFALLDKPYMEAFAGLEEEIQTVTEDAKNGNDDAFLPSIFVPALAKCYNYTARWHTNYNALLTSLDIYAIYQQTGKLPEALPETSSVDYFTGKPFIYEITNNGFTLRCNAEDPIDKKVMEYPYTLPRQ